MADARLATAEEVDGFLRGERIPKGVWLMLEGNLPAFTCVKCGNIVNITDPADVGQLKDGTFITALVTCPHCGMEMGQVRLHGP